jgi:hypothetical protein
MFLGDAALALHEWLLVQLEEVPHRLQAKELRRLGDGYFVKLFSPGEHYQRGGEAL